MRKSNIDVPVALIFFNRPEQFERVFKVVKKAAPSKLFLIQDGARENNDKDAENVLKCRAILEGIDWECEVFKDYSNENLGCGKRIFTGLSKCFEIVDRLIILEDDCVPSDSFFPFCKELLEKYKNDNRVGLITGMNHLNSFDKVKSDYFFANVGSIAGWATWKRSWDLVDYDLSGISNDDEAMRLLQNYQQFSPNRNTAYDNVMKKKKMLDEGKKLTSWSTQFGTAQILNSSLILVPKYNLMTNIGLSEESANSVSNIKFVPKGLQPLYRLKLFDMEFPLKHPKYIISDIEYGKEVDKLMRPGWFARKWRKLESITRRLFIGDFGGIIKKVLRK